MYIEVEVMEKELTSPTPYGAREETLRDEEGIDSDDDELHHAQLD